MCASFITLTTLFTYSAVSFGLLAKLLLYIKSFLFVEMSATGAKFRLMPILFNKFDFSLVSFLILSMPPCLYRYCGEANGYFLKFLLVLTRLTVPPSSSTAMNMAILEAFWHS